MAKDKNKKVDRTEAPETEVVETETQEVARGPNGELGVATASLTIKQMWHQEHHVLEDVGDARNPRKQLWVRKQGAPSLKKYARQLLASGNQVAKDWFAHKGGSMDAQRSDKNKTRIALEAQATRAAKRKKGQGKSGTAKPAA